MKTIRMISPTRALVEHWGIQLIILGMDCHPEKERILNLNLFQDVLSKSYVNICVPQQIIVNLSLLLTRQEKMVHAYFCCPNTKLREGNSFTGFCQSFCVTSKGVFRGERNGCFRGGGWYALGKRGQYIWQYRTPKEHQLYKELGVTLSRISCLIYQMFLIQRQQLLCTVPRE